MPSPPEAVNRVPLARGLVRLGLSLSPLFRRAGVAGRRERPLLAVALIAPFLLFLLPGPLRTPIGLAATIGLAAWMLRGRTLRLHGAEHRAIAAVEERRLLATWEGAAKPSRFSPRCGTNFAALALPVTWLADRFWPLAPELWTPLVVTGCRAGGDDGGLALRPGAAAPHPARPGSRASAADDPRARARGHARRAARSRLGSRASSSGTHKARLCRFESSRRAKSRRDVRQCKHRRCEPTERKAKRAREDQTICSARFRPRRPHTVSRPPIPSATANASATCDGLPEMSPVRPRRRT